jgi:hypothetical protein
VLASDGRSAAAAADAGCAARLGDAWLEPPAALVLGVVLGTVLGVEPAARKKTKAKKYNNYLSPYVPASDMHLLSLSPSITITHTD